jgi:transcriptional regulator with XRE-family HTH domain
VDDPWFQIARRIRTQRQRLGLSARDLSVILDCSRTTIHNWEAGRPIPLERCSQLAEALQIDTDELLRLHPYAADPEPSESMLKVVRTGPSRRQVSVAIAVFAIVLVGAVVATWRTATTGCYQPGAGGGSMLGAFDQAYHRYGGKTTLGCATNEVHKWGSGYVQDFEGGTAGRGILMTLDRTHVYSLAGSLFWSYVDLADGATADIAGVAVGDPVLCDSTVVVPLDGGLEGPGALVSMGPQDAFVWLPGDIWAAYKNQGGPDGLLGAPVSTLDRSEAGQSVAFAHGRIKHLYGTETVVDLVAASETPAIPLDIATCTPVPISNILVGDFAAGE